MPDLQVELEYEAQDDIPENVRGLYDEKDGKFVLTGVSGLKTQNDITAVQEALRKEREDHAKVRDQLKPWSTLGKKPDEIQAELDRIAELKAAAEGKIDETKMEELVNGRLKQHTGPLERQLSEKDERVTELTGLVEQLQNSIETRDRNDVVRQAAMDTKVHNTDIDDILMVAGHVLEKTDDGQFITKADVKGVTPGVDVKTFMKEMQKTRPHWWPQSEGGGAGGGGAGVPGGGKNPWSADGWNFTDQSRIVKEQGMEVAEKLAKAAGTSVGGMRPQQKK